MLDSVQGRLVRREATRAVVEVGGIGLDVHVPLSTSERLPERGQPVRLLLHLSVREDDWRLFGFLSEAERDVFRALLRVSGVGPVVALGVLSGLDPSEFRQAVSQGDVRALARVKGIGRKKAERIVVELRDVVEAVGGPSRPGGVAAPSGPQGDAMRALQALGFEPEEARRRVAAQAERLGEGAATADLVRAALRAG